MIFYAQHPDDSQIYVGTDGSIWRKINDTHPERRQWLLRKLDTDADGYKRCRVAGNNEYVHRMVYRCHLGELKTHRVVCHLDGVRDHNAVHNLTQATQRENIAHKRIHGTHQSGESHPRSLHTEKQAQRVYASLKTAARSNLGRLVRGETARIAEEEEVDMNFVRACARTRSHWECTL